MRHRILSSILFISLVPSCGSSATPEVRPPFLAGTWYPSEKSELSVTIASYLSKAMPPGLTHRPLVAVLPHAGYVYSGSTAAWGYKSLASARPDLIVIIGPSHRTAFPGCSVHEIDYYETPLGKVKVAREIAEKLSREPGFTKAQSAFMQEHCIEIQLPFLQSIYGERMERDCPILPVLAGTIDQATIPAIARALARYIAPAREPLVIVSSDFTHYGPRFGYLPFPGGAGIQDRLHRLDKGAIDCILKKDGKCLSGYAEKTGITACGLNPLLIALSLPMEMGEARLLKYDTSCNVTGECDDSVSYAAIIIEGGSAQATAAAINIPQGDRAFLLALARNNIRSHLASGHTVAVRESSLPASCRERRGVFVTLTSRGDLRGCIGTITGTVPLWRGVIDNSYNAAFSDPRFPPLGPDELSSVRIEISVLTEPRIISSPGEIVVGRDGIIIEMGGRRGLLLPQVAMEYGWSVEEFLAHACRKAGLPDDAWRRGAVIYTFQALVFGEG
jgi:MEMO1 family protein